MNKKERNNGEDEKTGIGDCVHNTLSDSYMFWQVSGFYRRK